MTSVWEGSSFLICTALLWLATLLVTQQAWPWSGHDPSRSGFNLLALEPAFSMRLGDHLQGFVVQSYLTDSTGHFTGGNEEAFLKLVDLPGDIELRGGRYFNRFGFQNARHNHSWDYVDQNLTNSRLLQEGRNGIHWW